MFWVSQKEKKGFTKKTEIVARYKGKLIVQNPKSKLSLVANTSVQSHLVRSEQREINFLYA